MNLFSNTPKKKKKGRRIKQVKQNVGGYGTWPRIVNMILILCMFVNFI